MSAADKLRALDKAMVHGHDRTLADHPQPGYFSYREIRNLRKALPALIAVVEAAEGTLHYYDGRAVLKHKPGICALCDSLAALDAALPEETP